MIKFFLGLFLTIVGIFSLILLSYAFRDFSFALTAMFIFTLVVYPYGLYLMIKNRKYEISKDLEVRYERKIE